MRQVVVVVAAAVCVSGCTDTTSLLAEGRVADAGLRACARPEDRAVVEAWLIEHAPVRFTVVPQSTLAAALGGPVRIDSKETAPLPYDVDSVVPEATVMVRVPSAAPLQKLVHQLPTLAFADRVPVAAAIDPNTLRPTPHTASRGGGDFISDMLDATVAVGSAVGVAIATPFVAMGAAIGGIADALFGSSGSASNERAPLVPILPISAVDGTTDNALLTSEELRIVAVREQETYEALRQRTLSEQQRRIALLDDDTLLSPGDCNSGHCRVLLKEVPAAVDVEATFAREDFFGEQRCTYEYVARTTVAGKRADALVDASIDVNADVNEARAFATITTPLQPHQPSWALMHNAALPKKLAPKPQVTTRTTTTPRLDRLGCTLRIKPAWRSVHGPGLMVRATFGKERSRTTLMGLRSTKEPAFVVYDVALLPGERARLSVSDEVRRSLGAAIVTFDGTTPLVFENAAFRAVCAEAPVVDDAVVDDAIAAATAAVQRLADDPNGVSSPRPQYELRRRREHEAEAAVVAAAALVGFNDARLTTLLAAFEAAR